MPRTPPVDRAELYAFDLVAPFDALDYIRSHFTIPFSNTPFPIRDIRSSRCIYRSHATITTAQLLFPIQHMIARGREFDMDQIGYLYVGNMEYGRLGNITYLVSQGRGMLVPMETGLLPRSIS
jgi:hypothetical protein